MVSDNITVFVLEQTFFLTNTIAFNDLDF